MPLLDYRFRNTDSDKPLPKCRFELSLRNAASELPLPKYHFRIAASELRMSKRVIVFYKVYYNTAINTHILRVFELNTHIIRCIAVV